MKRDYPDRPILAVGVVVIKGDTILLIKRSKAPKPDQWSIPGGMQELGETTCDAAIREVFEETNITITEPHFLKVVDFIERDEDNNIKHHYTLIDYMATYQTGSPSPGDDAIDVQWVPIDQISRFKLWSETESIIYTAIEKIKTRPDEKQDSLIRHKTDDR